MRGELGAPVFEVTGNPGSVGSEIEIGFGIVGGVTVGIDGVEGVEGVTVTGGVGVAFTVTAGNATAAVELRLGFWPPWHRPSHGVEPLLPCPWCEVAGPPLLLLAWAALWASPGPSVGIGGSLVWPVAAFGAAGVLGVLLVGVGTGGVGTTFTWRDGGARGHGRRGHHVHVARRGRGVEPAERRRDGRRRLADARRARLAPGVATAPRGVRVAVAPVAAVGVTGVAAVRVDLRDGRRGGAGVVAGPGQPDDRHP